MSVAAAVRISCTSATIALSSVLALSGPAEAQSRSTRVAAGDQEKPTNAVPGPRRLKGEEIRSLLTGKSARFVAADGKFSGTNVWRANGELSATTKILGFTKTFSGTWAVEGDRFCKDVLVDFINSRCQTVTQVSESSYEFVNEDGSVASVVTFGPR